MKINANHLFVKCYEIVKNINLPFWGTRGSGFESRRPDQLSYLITNNSTGWVFFVSVCFSALAHCSMRCFTFCVNKLYGCNEYSIAVENSAHTVVVLDKITSL